MNLDLSVANQLGFPSSTYQLSFPKISGLVKILMHRSVGQCKTKSTHDIIHTNVEIISTCIGLTNVFLGLWDFNPLLLMSKKFDT